MELERVDNPDIPGQLFGTLCRELYKGDKMGPLVVVGVASLGLSYLSGCDGKEKTPDIAPTAAPKDTLVVTVGGKDFDMIDDSRLPFRVAKQVITGSKTDGERKMAETPDHRLRIPTEAELEMINELLGNQLEGNHCWIWTNTEHEEHPGQFVVRRLGVGVRAEHFPGTYFSSYAVRFVEDK